MPEKARSEDFSTLSSSLARDARDVDRAVETMARRIDRMVVAVRREDWMAVRRDGRRLAQKARREGYRIISALASRVYGESAKRKNVVGIKRSMIRLVGAQGRIRRRSSG